MNNFQFFTFDFGFFFLLLLLFILKVFSFHANKFLQHHFIFIIFVQKYAFFIVFSHITIFAMSLYFIYFIEIARKKWTFLQLKEDLLFKLQSKLSKSFFFNLPRLFQLFFTIGKIIAFPHFFNSYIVSFMILAILEKLIYKSTNPK